MTTQPTTSGTGNARAKGPSSRRYTAAQKEQAVREALRARFEALDRPQQRRVLSSLFVRIEVAKAPPQRPGVPRAKKFNPDRLSVVLWADEARELRRYNDAIGWLALGDVELDHEDDEDEDAVAAFDAALERDREPA